MKVLITAATAAAMALTFPGLAASAAVTPHPAAAKSAVLGWGDNEDNAIGGSSMAANVLTPVPVSVPAGVTVASVRAGCAHSVALTSTGKLLAWGANSDGEVGDGTTKTPRKTPVSVKLPANTKITAVRAGCDDSIALTKTGTVLSWGLGLYGELGDGGLKNADAPVQAKLPKGTKIKSVSAGCFHNVALTTSGTLYAWGRNSSGQLGDGTHKNRRNPVAVKLPAGVKATGVSAGCDYTLALTSDGLYAWGNNLDGQLGTGDKTSHDIPQLIPFLFRGTGPGTITSVFAGCNHTIALFSKGAVLAWGSDQFGQLGDDGNATELKPVAVMLPTTITVKSISAGCDDGYALATNGEVFAWGLGTDGELGDASQNSSAVPVTVAKLTTLDPTAIGTGPAAGHAFVIVRVPPS